MAPASGEDATAKIQILKDALYEEARQHGSESRLFSQADLQDLGVVPANDVMLLLKVIQALTDDKLFVACQGAALAWRWRSREEAKKYTSLNDETMMVYSVIDEAGADGIWNRTIKHRLNMHEAVVKNCIKTLETKGYIVSMKNVEHPNKKMYIKANLRPSDRATGGPWFTGGELDSAFIEELQNIVFEYIKTHSAYLGSQGGRIVAGGAGGISSSGGGALKVPKKVIRGTAPTSTTTSEAADAASRGVKRAAIEISNDVEGVTTNGVGSHHPAEAAGSKGSASAVAGSRASKNKVYLPFPAGYKLYPTVSEIAKFIHNTGITNNTTLGEADIQQLVDVLTFDGLVEPIKVNSRKGYRVVRPTKQDTVPYAKRMKEREEGIGLGLDMPLRTGAKPLSNGLTEAPCGRCPVADMCEEGGPVSPNNCVYFLQWLGLEERGSGQAQLVPPSTS
ncbi:DNA-directed RNA polymerase III-like protein [Podospora didyma]|uniref:DNA-directed RNA polymerase III-like protein n=1 Tax=Podospora didyma TaxID=330526 RepID=A0AAE0P4V1_9PEZI|nr:DNA-directed RNA polymerase III-like protein [Podospora didyma]